MIDEEYDRLWRAVLLLAAFLFGAGIGGFITSLRYDSDIRTDQLELKAQVVKVEEDEATVEDIIKAFLFETKQLKLEREDLRRLQLELSKGEVR